MTIRHTTTNLPHYHSTHYTQSPVPKGHNFMHIKHTVTYTHTETTIPTPCLHYTKYHKPPALSKHCHDENNAYI